MLKTRCNPLWLSSHGAVWEMSFRRGLSCNLRETLTAKIASERETVKNFRKQYGSSKIGEITVNMIYGGMRGMVGPLRETSVFNNDEGIRFRGLSIAECKRLLPTAGYGEEFPPEALFWLLLTSQIPSTDQVRELSCDWITRSTLPQSICNLLEYLPTSMHPALQLSIAVAAFEPESKFTKAISSGVPSIKHWEYAYEDCMDLVARLPAIAAIIYRNAYHCGEGDIVIDRKLDWSANFAQMLGNKDPSFADMMRLYLTMHCDHEHENVVSHVTHLVGSTLCSPYLAFASGLNSLAGSQYGKANQNVVGFLLEIEKRLGKNPKKENLEDFVRNFMKSGQMIPGYGHEILGKADPRFTCLREFALKHLPQDDMFMLVNFLYDIVPPILKTTDKEQNPWPNIDALSGVLLQHYGIKQLDFYSVFFGISEALGALSSIIWSRALGLPTSQPNPVSTSCLMNMVEF